MSESAAVTPGSTRRVPRWLWATLIASLAVNLMLVGLIAGAAAFRYRLGGSAIAGPGTPWGFIRTLPRERREELREANRERLQQLRPMWQHVIEARRESDRLLTTEPYESDRFYTAYQRMLDAEADARKAGARILADTAGRLTPEERRGMLRWRDHERHHRRGGRERDRDDGVEPPPRQ